MSDVDQRRNAEKEEQNKSPKEQERQKDWEKKP